MSIELYQQAANLGYEHGRNVGSWMIDGNTTDYESAVIREGYDNADPVVMDMCPSPLSGEWADDPTPNSVLAELDVDPADDMADAYLGQYEDSFRDGFWEEVLA